ncbi:MAG: type III-A CRISPR-associated RAMP protein Csm3 [Desulfuromonadaceae bacterium]|nr:type III-A CRISPR-associated RAMP protein Csm3 [Desulfuromonadaceae bacterium]MDD2855879.1 type III-A CRISPR-associated RAMP protein Csm3 [Desulfuromonadaceae bacterium]
MKLNSYSKVTGVIRCETGLRIGGSKDSLEIGTSDNPIIRHPISGLPYIPGSSLKGKMRSLLEVKAGTFSQRGGACDCGKYDECEICRLFGCGSPQKAKEMTRLIFRDAMVTKVAEEILRDAQAEKGVNFAEVKNENWIDRTTGKAGNGGIRNQERVPEGTTFDFEISVRVFDCDNKEQFKNKLVEGLKLMECDYLGSSGSRGYGQIKFLDLKFDNQPFTL